MGVVLNETHDPALKSWVESANDGSDFPIQNLPFAVFRRPREPFRGGVAFGVAIVDLAEVGAPGVFCGRGGRPGQSQDE